MAPVFGWIGSVLAAGGIGAALLQVGFSLVAGAVLAKLNRPRGPRPSELQTEVKSSSPDRIRVLGRARVGGAILFWDWAVVNGQRRLFKLIAVASGGMTDVEQFYLNGEPVEVDNDGYVTTSPWNRGNVRLRWRSGIQGSGQWDGGAFPALINNFGGWDGDHRARGVGCILATFDAVEAEQIAEVYAGGDPEVTARVRGNAGWWPFGADPGPSPGHMGPVHQLADILVNPDYGPLTADDLDRPTWNAARQACAVDLPTSGGTRTAYLSGFAYPENEAIKDTAQKILDAMGGRAWITPEGKIGIEAGEWIPPTVTIEERHIVEMSYDSGIDQIDRTVTLVPSYVAPETNYQETTADPVEDTAAIARWGEGQAKSFDLTAVQHHGQAAHLAKQQLARINPPSRMTVTLRMFGLLLFGERRAFVNIPRLNLNNTPFWIEGLDFDGTNIRVQLIQAVPSSFSWTAEEEGTAPEVAPSVVNKNLSNYVDISIESLTVDTDRGDPYITVDAFVEYYSTMRGYEIIGQHRKSGEPNWSNGTDTSIVQIYSQGTIFQKQDADVQLVTPPLVDGATYDFRVGVGTMGAGGSVSWIIDPIEITGIQVIANANPPDDPVLASEDGTVGGPLEVVFNPALGANYYRTGLYRAAPNGNFGNASLVKWDYATSNEVTITANIPAAGGRYWLQSENRSGVKSGNVLVGVYQ